MVGYVFFRCWFRRPRWFAIIFDIESQLDFFYLSLSLSLRLWWIRVLRTENCHYGGISEKIHPGHDIAINPKISFDKPKIFVMDTRAAKVKLVNLNILVFTTKPQRWQRRNLHTKNSLNTVPDGRQNKQKYSRPRFFFFEKGPSALIHWELLNAIQETHAGLGLLKKNKSRIFEMFLKNWGKFYSGWLSTNDDCEGENFIEDE